MAIEIIEIFKQCLESVQLIVIMFCNVNFELFIENLVKIMCLDNKSFNFVKVEFVHEELVHIELANAITDSRR